MVHSPETATGSARQNKLKRWRKPGWQAPLSPYPGPCRTRHDGARGQSVSRHQSTRPEAQRFRIYHANAGQAFQWGAGVPNLLPRALKLDILEVNGLNKVDFSQIGRLVDQNWQALEPCPSTPVSPVSSSLTLNPLTNASHGSVGPTRLHTPSTWDYIVIALTDWHTRPFFFFGIFDSLGFTRVILPTRTHNLTLPTVCT